jgi:hypothetical protein
MEPKAKETYSFPGLMSRDVQISPVLHERSEDEVMEIKKPVGRPKKVAKESPPPEVIVATAAPKKQVGRPRKII